MKIAVFTALVGAYDKAPPQINPEPGVDYFLFTDRIAEFKGALPWTILPNPWPTDGTKTANRRASRAAKLDPVAHLPPHDVSVYIDANLEIKKHGFAHWCADQLRDHVIAAPIHVPRRGTMNIYGHDCLYEEGKVCIALGLDKREPIEQQMWRYRECGFPAKFGLLENCVLARRSTPQIDALGKLWTHEYMFGSQRDQCSLMFCLWKSGMRWKPLPIHARKNVWYEQREHQQTRKICASGA